MEPPFVRTKEKFFCLSRIQPIEQALTIDLRVQQRKHFGQIGNFPHDGSFQNKKEKKIIQKTDYKRIVFSIALQGISDKVIGV